MKKWSALFVPVAMLGLLAASCSGESKEDRCLRMLGELAFSDPYYVSGFLDSECKGTAAMAIVDAEICKDPKNVELGLWGCGEASDD